MNIGVAENPDAQAMANAMRGEGGNRHITYPITGHPPADALSGIRMVLKQEETRLSAQDVIALLKCEISLMENHIERTEYLKQKSEFERAEEMRHKRKQVEQLEALAQKPPIGGYAAAGTIPDDTAIRARARSEILSAASAAGLMGE